MIKAAADGINRTHEYLIKMGARPAADKSYNFSTTKVGRDWLENTWWCYIQDAIPVVKDFRYLGAHLTTGGRCLSATIDKRWTKAITLLQRLRYIPASVEAKIRIIHAKIFAAVFYGVEAAEIAPHKVAKLSAAIIDFFDTETTVTIPPFSTPCSLTTGRTLTPLSKSSHVESCKPEESMKKSPAPSKSLKPSS